MAEKRSILTEEGLKKIEQQLENLKSVRRIEVAQRIKQAIDFGDISENSEYDDAKNEQAFIEGEILRLEKLAIPVPHGRNIHLRICRVGRGGCRACRQ